MSVAFDDDGRTRIMQLLLMGVWVWGLCRFWLGGCGCCGCEERDIHREREGKKQEAAHITQLMN